MQNIHSATKDFEAAQRAKREAFMHTGAKASIKFRKNLINVDLASEIFHEL